MLIDIKAYSYWNQGLLEGKHTLYHSVTAYMLENYVDMSGPWL